MLDTNPPEIPNWISFLVLENNISSALVKNMLTIFQERK